jgi:hypothetical protein
MQKSYFFLLVFVLPVLTLATGCPKNKQASKFKAATAQTIANIDSASLVHHLAVLSSAEMAGRETGTPGNKLAQDYILHMFDSLQLIKPGSSYLQPFPFGRNGQQGTNIMGYIKGTTLPDSFIVITAHYDHLGTRNGTIYYGTDDNASGTAALLAMTQYFKQHIPQHSLLFVAFDAEEKGLLGSKFFVANAPLPIQAFTMNLNMDMVSRNDSSEIYASGTFHYPFLKQYVDSIQPYTPVHILFGHDDPSKGSSQNWTNQSDHYSFHQSHIPYLYFGVEDHPDYHQPGDTFDKVNKSFYYQVCTAITGVVLLLDKQPAIR